MMIISVVLFYMFWKRQWIFVKNTIAKNDNVDSKLQKNMDNNEGEERK
ncbi:hypothetical protein BH18THE2_BH18THE2_32180 [soil metagenome]